MTLRRPTKTFTLIATIAALGLTACSDEDEEEHVEDSHEPTEPSCIELIEVCHEADTGTGPAHECHETAHADDEAACAAALPDCMTACM
jgi:hypothetical protein